jgi:hypothetical protein
LGDTAKGDILSGVDMTWSRIKGGAAIGKLLEEARNRFQPENPAAILPTLIKTLQTMNDVQKSTGENYWIPQKRKELLEVIRSAAGMWIEAIAQGETAFSAAPGEKIKIAASIVNRSPASLVLKRVSCAFAGTGAQTDSVMNKEMVKGKMLRTDATLCSSKCRHNAAVLVAIAAGAGRFSY